LDGEGRHAPWDRHAELAQDFLGLVFVDFHERTFTESVDTADRDRIAADCRAHTPSQVGAAEPGAAAQNCIMVHCTKGFA
jgi:hypothetical protein